MFAIALAEHVATCSYCANDRSDLCRAKRYSNRLREIISEGDPELSRRLLGKAAADNATALSRLD